MIAAYVRVSSLTQNYKTQRHAIEQRAKARGELEHVEWFEETRSAKSMLRPELERLRIAVRARTVERLYVYRLDRLSRTGIRDTFEIIEETRAHGCELVSIADGFELAGPAADVIIAVMAWAAQQERLVRNERIASARARCEALGQPWGRPPRMTPAQIESAKRLRARGATMRQVAAALGIPRSTLAKTLTKHA